MSKSEALRLARELEACPTINYKPHAAELRRLHADNENTLKHFNDAVEGYKKMAAQHDALLEALKNIERSTYDAGTAALARAAIAKTEGNT